MTHLPAHRRCINGRTFASPWSASSMDPIRHYPRTGVWASRLLAVAIAVALALVLIRWIDWSLA